MRDRRHSHEHRSGQRRHLQHGRPRRGQARQTRVRNTAGAQVHRAVVVRVDAIEQVSRNFRGNQVLTLKGTNEKLEVSRTFNHLFKQM